MTDIPLPLFGLAGSALAFVLLMIFRRRGSAAAVPPEGRAFHQTMEPGRAYEVVHAFTDYDGRERVVGERWVFRGYNFLPHEDGLTLHTDPGPGVRLQWRPESRASIIDNLADHIALV